jgi:hypothetical protein
MKIAERVGTRLVRWGTAATMAFCATALIAASDKAGSAQVRYVFGTAQVAKGTGAGQAVERYMILHSGDVIKTDGKSHVDLALGNNNGSVQVTPASDLALEKLSYMNNGLEVTHDTQLFLRSGTVAGVVNKMAAASKYEVKTPKGVVGIRGGRYRISANGDVAVTDGRAVMALTMPDGSVKTFTIDQGNMLAAATGQIRPLSRTETREINEVVGDAGTHGGYLNGLDPASRQFFQEAQNEPYVPPNLQPQEVPVSPVAPIRPPHIAPH